MGLFLPSTNMQVLLMFHARNSVSPVAQCNEMAEDVDGSCDPKFTEDPSKPKEWERQTVCQTRYLSGDTHSLPFSFP